MFEFQCPCGRTITITISGEGEPPPEAKTVVITRVPVANARFIKAYNKKGKPIMAIYPKDSAPPRERIQYKEGAFIEVHDQKTIADGGGIYFEVISPPIDERLFLRDEDVR